MEKRWKMKARKRYLLTNIINMKETKFSQETTGLPSTKRDCYYLMDLGNTICKSII